MPLEDEFVASARPSRHSPTSAVNSSGLLDAGADEEFHRGAGQQLGERDRTDRFVVDLPGADGKLDLVAHLAAAVALDGEGDAGDLRARGGRTPRRARRVERRGCAR